MDRPAGCWELIFQTTTSRKLRNISQRHEGNKIRSLFPQLCASLEFDGKTETSNEAHKRRRARVNANCTEFTTSAGLFPSIKLLLLLCLFCEIFFFPQKLAGDLARESNVLPSLRKSHKVWVISISRFYICLSHSSSPRRSAFFSPFEASRGERTTENYSASTILDIFVSFSSTPLNAAKHRKGWSISRQRHETPEVFRKVNCLIRVTSLMTKYITESATRRH